MTCHDLTRSLEHRLRRKATPTTKSWWEDYLRGTAAFRGVPLPSVRTALHDWWRHEHIAERCTTSEQRRIALSLLSHRHTEDKLAGMLLIQEILLPNGLIEPTRDLPAFARLSAQGSIADWNSCDWFCVKVLGPMARLFGRSCAMAISRWRTSDNLWQQRASAVAFVNLAKDGEENFRGFVPMLLRSCSVLAARSERFAQTGAGWVLRELSRADRTAVESFLRRHMPTMSREAVLSASAKLPPATRRQLLTLCSKKLEKPR